MPVVKAYKFKLKTNANFAAACCATLDVCRELYNVALQERRDAYLINGLSINYHSQALQLPQIKTDMSRSAFIKSQISSLANATLNWLCTNSESFKHSNFIGKELNWRVEPLGELSFMLMTLKRHGIRNRLTDRLTAYALEEANTLDWQELAAYDPSAATMLALIADFFITEGRPLPFERPYFDFLSDIGYFRGMDRLAYREMGLAYSLGRMGDTRYEASLAAWFAHTPFGLRQHPARYGIDDLYSLTRSVFYLTDMGLRDATQFLDAETTTRLKNEIVLLTAVMVRADNANVLGELALCWLLCGIEINELRRTILNQALRRLFASATTEGAIAPTSKALARAKSSQANFSELYHTTLVCAMLFQLLRKRTYI
jgi:uncharacterized protein DUF6895/helix-turn-helix protein